jgi:uncharacterized protein YjcR
MERGRRISNIPKQQIEAEKLYLEGVKKRVIVAKVGISLMTLYRWVKKYNWESAYKQKYEEELSKITETSEKLLFLALHRPPKENIKQ